MALVKNSFLVLSVGKGVAVAPNNSIGQEIASCGTADRHFAAVTEGASGHGWGDLGGNSWPLGVSLQNLELVAESNVLQFELPAGFEGGRKYEKDDFEHPFMPYSRPRNGNGPRRIE